MEKYEIKNQSETAAVPEEKIYPPHSVRIYPKPYFGADNEEPVPEPIAPVRPNTKTQAKIDALQTKLDEKRAKLNAKIDEKQAEIDILQKKEDEKNARLLAKRRKKQKN